MKRVMSLFVVLLFVAGCTPGVEDLINELDGYEEYECYYGDARLPVGSHPEYLITPEGYVWECDDIGDVSFHSDGTFSATLNSRAYSETRDYFDDCNGFPSREQTGEWVVHDHLAVSVVKMTIFNLVSMHARDLLTMNQVVLAFLVLSISMMKTEPISEVSMIPILVL